MTVSADVMKKLYGDMQLVRHFEGRLVDLVKQGLAPGSVHLGLGQEACMAGTCIHLSDEDTIGATHREHGVLLCRGVDPGRTMAEIFGRANGLCKGKGGSMHTCDLSKGCLGNNAILGIGQSIINGYTFANKVRKNGKVGVTMYGDGASNRGDIHEGMNFAAIWKLPTIFILQDNQYAMSTHISKSRSMSDETKRAEAYGIPAKRVDGNDVLAVMEAVGEAVERGRKGEGPSFIQLDTYRWRGHFEGDPNTYRTKAEIKDWMEHNDPIKRFEKVLLEQKVMTEAEMQAVSEEKKGIVDAAQKFAEGSEPSGAKEMYSDVYYHYEGSDK